MLYKNDIDSVNISIGTLTAKPVNLNINSKYWIASRRYVYEPNSDNKAFGYTGRTINSDNVLSSSSYFIYYSYDTSTFLSNNNKHYIRPILTLKSNLKANGNGTSVSPYILS